MTSPNDFDTLQSVLAMLNHMRDEAEDIAVSTGTTPTAEEALDQAIINVEAMIAGRTENPARSEGPR